VSIEVGHSSTAVVTPTTGPTHDKYVVGYFAQWAIYARDFNVSDIEAEHLTHLMYAFYDVKFEEDDSGTVSLTTLDDWADFGHTEDPGVLYGSNPKGNFGALKVLKMENPHLNILMSIGGWTRSIDIPAIANDPVKTDMLVPIDTDADIGFVNGIFRSFSDASFQGELAEITWALGAEYKIKNNFSLRSGYYRESVEQGNLRFFSLGTGFEKNGLRLDFSYLINTSTIQNQLQNSLRLSLGVPLNFGIKQEAEEGTEEAPTEVVSSAN
jgi:hypothetical protein